MPDPDEQNAKMPRVELPAEGPEPNPEDTPAGVKVNSMSLGWVATRMVGSGAPRPVQEEADTAGWLDSRPDDGPTDGSTTTRQRIP
jgi:hypothetical protein